MTGRARRAFAAAGAALALAACALLFAAHWRAEPFAAAFAVTARPLRRAAQAAVAWPHGTVNPNTATSEELCALQGVGPALAEAIVAERVAHGVFSFPEDLLEVKGIGEKKLQKFYDQLDFSGEAGSAVPGADSGA